MAVQSGQRERHNVCSRKPVPKELYIQIEEQLNFRNMLARSEKVCTFKDIAFQTKAKPHSAER